VAGKMVHSLVSFGHNVTSNQINSSRIYAGSYTQHKQLYAQLRQLLRHRGIRSENLSLDNRPVGLGWDVENDLFKLYVFFEDYRTIPDAEIQQLSQLLAHRPTYPQGIASWTWRGGHELYEKKLYLGLPDDTGMHAFGSAIKHTTAMLTTKRGIVPQLDVQTQTVLPMNKTARDLIAWYETKGVKLDTCSWKSPHQQALYFS